MRLLNFGLIGSAMLMATACQRVAIENTFDATNAGYYLAKGTGSIEGQGFWRQNGGGVVTCAGAEAVLLPVTPYTREVATANFGSDTGGHRGLIGPIVENGGQLPDQFAKTTKCDAQGNFKFSELADGEYYVGTTVTWQVGSSFIPEGGALMSRATVENGGATEVVMSP